VSTLGGDSGNALIEVRGVSVRFGGVHALDAVDLGVGAGEIVCIVGGNGAGKTTLLNALLGFVDVDAGGIHVCGANVLNQPALARQAIALVPEQMALYPALTGFENLQYFLRLSGGDAEAASVMNALALAGLPAEAALRRAGTYSKGMRQKTGLALAFARGARVLLLDEPASGLDPQATGELNAALRAAAARGGAVLAVTHDLAQAAGVADRVVFMKAGRVVRQMDGAQLSGSDLASAYRLVMQVL